MERLVKFEVIIKGETSFEDNESDIKTVIYLLEQDLEDAGWNVEIKPKE